MNLVDFSYWCEKIEKTADYTNLALKYEKKFDEKARENFANALKDLSYVLVDDRMYVNYPQDMWETAYRIVKLDGLYLKIDEIRKRTLDLRGPKYFSRKLDEWTLPTLGSRIGELRRLIAETNRLPFNVGSDRDFFYKYIKEKSEETSINTNDGKLKSAEIEYFHLLGNQLNDAKLNEINKDFYSGSLEIYSVLSWSRVLEAFVADGDSNERRIGKALLNIIHKIIPLAIKISYVSELSNPKELAKIDAEISYFKDYIAAYGYPKFSREFGKMTKAEFDKKYTLSESGVIPLKALENEIAWDMVELIDQMQEGESRLFLLGSKTHTVTVRISCFELPTYVEPAGLYCYEIFNTGNGVNAFHHVDPSGDRACPLVFNNVPKKVLAYPFFAQLIRHIFVGELMEPFYALHDEVLVKEGQALKLKKGNVWYMLQKQGNGICSYASVEAWVQSYFNEDQLKHLEIVKTKLSTHKQEQVVRVLEREFKEESSWQIIGKARKKVEEILMTKATKLKESRLLLDLGEAHLQELLQQKI